MPIESSAQRLVEALRVELYRKRLSQERAAELAGMTQSKISRRLNGEVEPTIGELEALAAAVDLEVHVELRPVAGRLEAVQP